MRPEEATPTSPTFHSTKIAAATKRRRPSAVIPTKKGAAERLIPPAPLVVVLLLLLLLAGTTGICSRTADAFSPLPKLRQSPRRQLLRHTLPTSSLIEMGARTSPVVDDDDAAVRAVYDRIVSDGKVSQAPVSPVVFALTVFVGVPLYLTVLLPLTVFYQIASSVLKKKNGEGDSVAAEAGAGGGAEAEADAGESFPSPSELKPRPERKYDVVLLGATGFAGRLAAEHLARTYDCGSGGGGDGGKGAKRERVRWAVAGRSEDKLRDALRDVAKLSGNAAIIDDVDVIVVDTADRSSLPSLVSDARCVISTAGPFSRYGSNVVEFCSKFGTHYADITGEVDWVRGMIDRWDDDARRTGARIVSLCGNDSVPWDLTVWKIAQKLREGRKGGGGGGGGGDSEELIEVTCLNDAKFGGPSGGTIATMFLGLQGDGGERKPNFDFDPFLRTADGTKTSSRTKPMIPILVERTDRMERVGRNETRWTTPFVMAAVNAEVVRRTNSLEDMGSNLTYRESLLSPDFASAFTSWFSLAAFVTAALNPITAGLLRNYALPKPGEGPSRQDMEGGYLLVKGRGVGSRGTVVESAMYFPADSGYMDTGRMLAESGLCLALEEGRLPMGTMKKVTGMGGFFSPAAGLGGVLLERLCRTGTAFGCRVVEGPSSR